MPELWTPEATPPQVSESASSLVLSRVMDEGIVEASAAGIGRLQSDQEQLGYYIDRLGFDLNNLSAEGYWPERVLKMGAGITWLAYRETGYFQPMDDAFESGKDVAIKDGIPDAYFSSLGRDQNLRLITETVLATPSFNKVDSEGYSQILEMGAGCVRFFMEQSLKAA